MPTVSIKPSSLSDLRAILEGMMQVASFRSEWGWPPFQIDEEWNYQSESDTRVCPVCQGNDYKRTYNGEEVPIVFPKREMFYYGNYSLHPHVHRENEDNFDPFTGERLYGECRCRLDMDKPAETLAVRLSQEMEDGIL